jgi:hypothetical protein
MQLIRFSFIKEAGIQNRSKGPDTIREIRGDSVQNVTFSQKGRQTRHSGDQAKKSFWEIKKDQVDFAAP